MKVFGKTERVTEPQLSNDPLSISEGSKVPVPAVSSTRVKVFALTVGETVSRTVTLEVQDAVLPEASVPVRVTGTAVPRSEQLKLVLLKNNNKVPGQLSVDPLFTSAGLIVAEPDWSRKTVIFLQTITGVVLSCTLTIALQVEIIPVLSVTVRVTLLDPIFEQVNVLGETIRLIIVPSGSYEPPSMSEPLIVTDPAGPS